MRKLIFCGEQLREIKRRGDEKLARCYPMVAVIMVNEPNRHRQIVPTRLAVSIGS